MEMPGLVPDNLSAPPVLINGAKVEPALSVIMEESSESSADEDTGMEASEAKSSGIPDDEAGASTSQANSSHNSSATSETPTLLEAVRSIEQLVRSKFDELNQTVTHHCRNTQQLLSDIRARINAFLRVQRPSIQRPHTATRSSRWPPQRVQYHQRSAALRTSTSRFQRPPLQRNGSQRASSLAGQRWAGIHRRSGRPAPLYPRDAAGLSRSVRVNGPVRPASSASLRNISSL